LRSPGWPSVPSSDRAGDDPAEDLSGGAGGPIGELAFACACGAASFHRCSPFDDFVCIGAVAGVPGDPLRVEPIGAGESAPMVRRGPSTVDTLAEPRRAEQKGVSTVTRKTVTRSANAGLEHRGGHRTALS